MVFTLFFESISKIFSLDDDSLIPFLPIVDHVFRILQINSSVQDHR